MMKIIKLLINEDLRAAEIAFERATGGDVIELARIYLGLLNAYREQLHKLGGIPQIDHAMRSAIAKELVEQSRHAVRSAIETTTSERNRVESLLESFTLISGWEAAAAFNEVHYEGANDWELVGSEVHSLSRDAGMSVQAAVTTAGALRREAYSNRNTRDISIKP